MKKLLFTRPNFILIRICLIILCSSFFIADAQVPTSWNSVGIGGGGALFNPSINPANTSEFYVACDMSEYFHSTDFGLSYSQLDWQEISGSGNGVIRFTNDP